MDYSTKISHDWQHIALLLRIPQHEVSTIDLNNPRIKQKCSDLFGYWLNRTPYACWCHFIQALYDVKLREIAEEAKAHLKLSNIDEQNTVDLYQLVKFLSDIPDCDLNYFIKELLTKEAALKVIEDIRNNDDRKENMTICQAFLKERDPSWAKVHKALEETECIDLADFVKVSFL